MNSKLLVVLCALAAASSVDGYHILCIFAVPSRSHNHLGKGVVNALLNGGHEVTWVTPFPPEKPQEGLHIIDASVTRPIADSVNMTDRVNAKAGFSFIRAFTANISSTISKIPALTEAITKGKFDAVATEYFFSDVEAGYAAVLQVPWITLSGVGMQPNTEEMVDEVRSVPIVPLLFNDFGVPMSFFERVCNVGLYNVISATMWWHQSETEKQYQDTFAPLAAARNVPLPSLDAAKHNVSILFVNTHPSFSIAQSIPPNVIEIGGYHIEETIQPLPKDLQDLLDASTTGVVYFSMGSVLKSSALPAATKQAILRTLGELPYTVLWKFEEELTGLPKNVHIRPWMPQAAILAHKNTRLFITHGGLLSNLETLRYGVPLIAIPMFGDQPANAARAVRAGYAVRADPEPDTMADSLRDALKQALGTDKYYKRAKYLSTLFNKRPVAPSKLITHYVELAIETKGAHHLRSKALLYSWYQRWMLDILAAGLLTLYIAYWILKKIIKTILNKLCGCSNVKKNKKKRD